MPSKHILPRTQPKKLLLDTLPSLHQLISLVIFIITIALSMLLTLLSPQIYDSYAKTVASPKQFDLLMHRESKFQHKIEGLNALNREVSYHLYLQKSPMLSSVTFNLQYKIAIHLKESDDIVQDFASDAFRTVEVTCEADEHFCNSVQLFKSRAIPIPIGQTTQDITIDIEFLGLDTLVQKERVIVESLVGKWVVVSQSYTVFEAVLRSIYVLTSIVLCATYVIVLLTKQAWRFCKSEQKLIIVLLLSLILYNNPLFFVDSMIGSSVVRWFGSLLDVLFTATFMCVFLLFVMIMSHFVLVPVKERTVLWFYAPKVFLNGFLWILLMITLTWERFREAPTPLDGVSVEKSNFFDVYYLFRYTLVSVLCVCFAVLAFYVIRGISDMSKRVLTHNYSVRLRNFWALTLLVVLAIIVFWALKLVGPGQGLGGFLISLPLFNCYALMLAALFSPSNEAETDLREIVLQEFEREQALADRENLFEMGNVDDSDVSL
mmetsp:Transcript_2773/g.10673  ORF Transcript_2773/g.10673 Transcript_2773/m.10673 type:complete len:490 (+) Transcript_2773:131-1600(+)